MERTDQEHFKEVLHDWMAYQSEERWCAGWLIGLAKSLKGDPTYDWLVEKAGGTFNDDEEFIAT
jgi:hypothetical protein